MNRLRGPIVGFAIAAAAATTAAAMGEPKDYSADFPDYASMRARVGALYQEENYAEAADILEWGLRQFPDRIHANAYNLALMHALSGERDKGIAALQYALDRGIWFGPYELANAVWEPYRSHPGFAAIQAACEARRLEAQKHAAMKFEVVTPEGFDPARRYPLFIALHGGGETMADLKPNWTSPLLAREFLVLFVQSSQVVSMTGFTWDDAATTCREVGEAYGKTLAEYPVDAGQVFVGGFSSGGGGALMVTLAAELPVKGFVILCPQIPDSLSDAQIAAVAQRGVRGTLLTTERDNRVELQRATVERFRQAGGDVRFHMTPDEGHWYPADLGELIDQAIGHIRGE
jgi:predicted esterase